MTLSQVRWKDMLKTLWHCNRASAGRWRTCHFRMHCTIRLDAESGETTRQYRHKDSTKQPVPAKSLADEQPKRTWATTASCSNNGSSFQQGQRTRICYSGEGLDEEFVIPSAAAAFQDQTVFARVLLQQGECESIPPNGVSQRCRASIPTTRLSNG